MSDATIQVRDASGATKDVDNELLAEGVHRQRVQLVGALLAEVARIMSSAPTGTEHGLVTRNIPSGTQAVSATILPLPTGAAREDTQAAVRAAAEAIQARLPAAGAASEAKLEEARASLGTDGSTPPALPGGATGVRGWLRGVYETLAARLPATLGTGGGLKASLVELGGAATEVTAEASRVKLASIEAKLPASGLAAEATLTQVRDALGTDGTTPPALPDGSTGVRGWMRATWERLGERASEAKLEAARVLLAAIDTGVQSLRADIAAEDFATEASLSLLRAKNEEIRAAVVAIQARDVTDRAARLLGQTTATQGPAGTAPWLTRGRAGTSTTATVSAHATPGTPVVLLAAAADRLEGEVHNALGSDPLYVKWGAGAAPYSRIVLAGEVVRTLRDDTSEVTGYWPTATGTAHVSECKAVP